jgi:ABC-2 type transport system permease protein
MRNVLKVAKKEFGDLLANRIIFIAVGLFLLFVLLGLSDFYSYAKGIYLDDIENPTIILAGSMLGQYTAVLTRYGAILAIAVGFLSISDERHSGALNTLVVKPLSRKTIIIGKMIGAIGFLLCVFAIASMILTFGLVALCGEWITPLIDDYTARIPLAIIAALLYSMIFFFSSLLISLIIKDYAFSLILSLMAWSFSELLIVYSFTGYIAAILGDEKGIGGLIIGISPDGIIKNITYQALTNFTVDLGTCVSLMTDSLMRLTFYVIILLIASCVVFTMEDIA